jgi:uncharacterized protein
LKKPRSGALLFIFIKSSPTFRPNRENIDIVKILSLRFTIIYTFAAVKKQTTMLIALLFLGILAGILSGMFGIGGGIIMVPMLVTMYGFDILNANATSLAAMLLPVGILGVIAYYKAGYINLRDSFWLAVGLFGGSFVGAELAVSIYAGLLAKLYAAFLLYIAAGYLDVTSWFTGKKKQAAEGGEQISRDFWIYIGVGIIAGIIAGMFGKGGGLVIVPILIRFFRYDAKSATATSLAALQLPVGLPSVLIYAHAGFLNYYYAGLLAVGIVVGVFFGTKLALNIPSATFKKVYAFFLLGVAVYMIYKYI